MSEKRLYEMGYEPCSVMEKVKTPDGEGGFAYGWAPSEAFNAAFEVGQPKPVSVGGKVEIVSVVQITVPGSVSLDYPDIIRRNNTQEYYRVTSSTKDRKTPPTASFQIAKVVAEKLIRLPDL